MRNYGEGSFDPGRLVIGINGCPGNDGSPFSLTASAGKRDSAWLHGENADDSQLTFPFIHVDQISELEMLALELYDEVLTLPKQSIKEHAKC